MVITFIVLQALAYIAVILLLASKVGGPRTATVLRWMALTFATWPLSTFVVRAIPGGMHQGFASHLLIWALAAAIAVVGVRARRGPLAALGAVSGATVALLVLDVAAGAPLQMSSVLGYSPNVAARFTGFGNTAYAVLGAAAIIWVAIHVERAPRRGEALAAAGAVLLVVLVADGAPWLGSDVGGLLSMPPVFALTLYVMSGRRLNLRVVLAAGVITAVCLAVVLGIDLLQPPESRTHFARFVAGSAEESSTFWQTISRKWATNLRVFQRSNWTWMVPIMSALLLYVLVVGKGWQRLLPDGSPRRAGVLGSLAIGILGWLVNDSGVVVAALVFVYLCAYLTVLALEPDPAGDLLEPTATPAMR
jgi:hypothetical protein